MDTWAIQESTNRYAFGAGLAVLAFAATRVSRQFDRPWRTGGNAPARKTRLRKRAKLKSSRVLADRAGEQKPTNEPAQDLGADEIFWPSKRPSDSSAGGYQSKHRLPGPARQTHRERRAPRHAAPSARFLAR
jgi:hypothetical protein